MDFAHTSGGWWTPFYSGCSSADVDSTGSPVLGLQMARGRQSDGTEITHVLSSHGLKSFQPVYTDAYLYEKDIFEEVEKFREAIFGEILSKANDMPAEWELVLDLGDDEGLDERVCFYYFVNCSNRTLFWLHNFDVTQVLSGLNEIKSKRRISESESPTSLITSINNLRP